MRFLKKESGAISYKTIMQIKLYSIRETTVWHVNGKLIWQSISPISIKGKRIDSTNYKIIDTVGFLGEILDQTIENMVCGLQAWHQEAVMSRKQLGFPEHPSSPGAMKYPIPRTPGNPKASRRWLCMAHFRVLTYCLSSVSGFDSSCHLHHRLPGFTGFFPTLDFSVG